MTLAAKVLGVSPANNPDSIDYLVTCSGNYAAPDVLNLAPYDEANNPGGATNPENIPLPSMPLGGLEQAPAVLSENIGGYYVNPSPLTPPAASEGVAGSISMKTGISLTVYEPGGAALGAGAYPGGMTGAGDGVIVRAVLPKDQ
jgi:hypothetical protein